MKLSPEDLAKLKAEHGSVIVTEFSGLGHYYLKPFGPKAYADYLDKAVVNADAAADRFGMRSILHPSFQEANKARSAKPKLTGAIIEVLLEDAGIPRQGRGEVWCDALDEGTSPMLLERAGLSREEAQRLLGERPEREHFVISISDRTREVYFGGVLLAPGDVETGMLRDLRARRKAVHVGMLSVVRSCLVWSREPLDATMEKFPAVVTVLVDQLTEVQGVDDLSSFRA